MSYRDVIIKYVNILVNYSIGSLDTIFLMVVELNVETQIILKNKITYFILFKKIFHSINLI